MPGGIRLGPSAVNNAVGFDKLNLIVIKKGLERRIVKVCLQARDE